MKSDYQYNILTSPIIRAGVDNASRVAVCIELFCRDINGDDKKVGSGTGFFHRRAGMSFLITNWHVLTGRDPQNPESLLEGYPASPTGFKVHLTREQDPNHFVPSDVLPMYEDGKPRWIETSAFPIGAGGRVDLVAVKFESPTTGDVPLITTIEEFAPASGDTLSVGRDVVIVGYPFGLNELNPYPIWKRGYVASEPSILIGGLPKFYIDSPGRPGMSGSPVFMIRKAIGLSPETHEILHKAGSGGSLGALTGLDVNEISTAPEVNLLHFAGVYSGAVGDYSLERLRIGVAWHAAMVDRLFTDPADGSNPYPPVQ